MSFETTMNKGFMMQLEDDQIAGWLSTDTVAKVITIVSSAKTSNEISKKVKSLNL